MADFQLAYLTVVNDSGDGQSGTLLDEAFFDGFVDDINAEMSEIEADIEALQAVGYLAGYDTVLYVYKNASTVTVQAGGQFVSDDELAFYTVASNTDVSMASNLSADAGSEAANTLYYIWGGEDALDNFEFWITDSPTVMPSELVRGKCLRGAIRNDNSSDLVPFFMLQQAYMYDCDVVAAGSDVTEVLDASVSTTFVDVASSGFIPSGIQIGIFSISDSASTVAYIRAKGASATTGSKLPASVYHSHVIIVMNTSREFQIKLDSGSGTVRVSVVGYLL